jgi:hypothetical protein
MVRKDTHLPKGLHELVQLLHIDFPASIRIKDLEALAELRHLRQDMGG